MCQGTGRIGTRGKALRRAFERGFQTAFSHAAPDARGRREPPDSEDSPAGAAPRLRTPLEQQRSEPALCGLTAWVNALTGRVKTRAACIRQNPRISTMPRAHPMQDHPVQDHPILVIGATGKTGARIVRLLQDRGHAVRPGARSAPIPFDWADETTWRPALSGMRAAHISYSPGLAFPGAAEKIEALAALARTLGTGRRVLLSGRGGTLAMRCGEIIRRSGVDFTLLRCAWFAQNFSEGYLRDPVMDGVLAIPAGDVREAIVDVDDIADVAAAALTEDRHSGALYEITGARLLHFAEAAEALAEAAGRPVRYQPITLAQFHEAMTAIGGGFIADVFTHVCEEALDGRNAWLGDGVQRALGRAPTDFSAFCRRAADAGAWADTAAGRI